MTQAVDKILIEIEEERVELRVNIILTTITLLGLIGAIIIGVMDGPLWAIIVAYTASYF